MVRRKKNKYIPRRLGFWSDLDSYAADRDILFSAVDALGEADTVDDIIHCLSDISFRCSSILRFGSRKITELERRKDGVHDV